MRNFFFDHAGDVFLVYGVCFVVVGAVAAVMPRREATLPFARDLWLISAFSLSYGLLELVLARAIALPGSRSLPPLLSAVWLALSYVLFLEFGRRQVRVIALASHSPRIALLRAPLVHGVAAGLAVAVTLWASTPAAGLDVGARYFMGFPAAMLSAWGLLFFARRRPGQLTVPSLNIPLKIMGLVVLGYGLLTPMLTEGETNFSEWLPTDRYLTGDSAIAPAMARAVATVLLVCGLAAMIYRTNVAVTAIETGLHESEHQLSEAQRMARIGSWVLDLKTGILQWSDEIFRIFEIDKTRFAASYEAFLAAIHPEDRDAVHQSYVNAVETRQPYQITHRLIMPDGTVKHVHERGETHYNAAGLPLRSVGTVQDITDRVAAERALRESEVRYRRIVENSNEGIFIVDEARCLTFVNPRMAEMFGCTTEDLLGRPIRDFIPESDRADSMERLAKRRQGISERYERRYRRADGGQITVQISSVPVFGDSGHFEGSTNMVVDITESKRLEQQFLQAQKMEAIGRLAGSMAHDFNNMLTVILGYASILQQKLEPDDPTREFAEQIRMAGERSQELTRRLLVFSRHQVLQLHVVDLNEIVRGMEPMLRRLVGEDIDLVSRLDAQPGQVRVDVGQMEQVIMNLVINARDAMPRGGKLVIEAAREVLTADYAREHLDVRPGTYVRLAVTDTGDGMSAEVQAHLFEPFFTTKGPGKGTGLGLSSSYGIVRNFGGHIWVYSEPGRGTTFKIYLPLEDGMAEAEPVREQAQTAGGNETILLVEDDAAVRELVRRVLHGAGYRVISAASGPEALEVCRQTREPLHLLLTDMVMPKMDGRELADQVRALNPRIKLVFMSGFTADTAQGSSPFPADARFLQKPILPETLKDQVRQALNT